MKKIMINTGILLMALVLWQSCIKDETIGVIRELSEITIQSQQDTFYVDFGDELNIPLQVSQTGELDLNYEWRAGWIKNSYGQIDSLGFVSRDPELNYSFRKMGEYKLRLRAYNDDGSTFYNFVVYVRAAFQEGLMVLSQDENQIGRTSFLRVKGPEEIVTGNEEFNIHAFEKVNPDLTLKGNIDMTILGNKVYLLSGDEHEMYELENESLNCLNIIRWKEMYPDLMVKKFLCTDNAALGSILWDDKGRVWDFNSEIQMIFPDNLFPEKAYDRIYFCNDGGGSHFFLINTQDATMEHGFYNDFPPVTFSSEDYFKGKNIVNCVGDAEYKLNVITTDQNDSRKVTITRFSPMNSFQGIYWPPFFYPTFLGAFLDPVDYSYEATSPLALDKNAIMQVNKKEEAVFFTKGNELYRWVYTGSTPKIPEFSFLPPFDGEITCLASSPDDASLYLGIWNPDAEEELKGSVYILDIKTKAIRKYRGVADKPLKIMYKGTLY